MKAILYFLLSDDEYKAKKITEFLAESALLNGILCFLFLLLDRLYSIGEFVPTIALMITLLAISILYVIVRYILSGIEFANVFTRTEFKNERKHLLFKAITFSIIFGILMVIVTGVPKVAFDVIQLCSVPLLAGFLLYAMNYVSLVISYRKNKSL
ncbi:hypothetical protein [Fictibacillus macauensis]|uniref:hypothetical protein n=1 Tax=Fictibacillus macauensis TaxID=245160 RepID=UPI0012EAD4E7|nr:hypothetical protein [Fictibacillus macauensis]